MCLLFGQTVRTKGLEVLSWRRFVSKLYNYAPLNICSPNCGCSGHYNFYVTESLKFKLERLFKTFVKYPHAFS